MVTVNGINMVLSMISRKTVSLVLKIDKGIGGKQAVMVLKAVTDAAIRNVFKVIWTKGQFFKYMPVVFQSRVRRNDLKNGIKCVLQSLEGIGQSEHGWEPA